MSFQSIDSDDFSVFSTGSLSPGADSSVPQYSSVEYVVNDNTGVRRNSKTSPVNDRSLYGDILQTDVASKEDSRKEESTDSLLGSEGWTVGDFISTSATTKVNQPPGISYQSVSPAVTSHSIKVTWNKSGTSTIPVAVSWNKLRASSPQNVTFTLGDDSKQLQQNSEHFSDAYDRVSFDRPKSQNSDLLTEAVSRDRADIPHLPSLSRLPDVHRDGLQNINSQCYEAAISEHFRHKKHLKLSQYVSKMKNSKPHSGNSQVYDRYQRGSPAQSPTHSKHPVDLGESPLTSPVLANESVSKDSKVTKTTFATFTMPSIPCPLSPFSTGSHSPGQADGQRSPKALKDPDLKKYRYNQTALALQQSGLMKTTIKTAELLRKSRLLQQELTKLRRETAVFVHAVLNNPENKHIKDMYMAQQKDKSISQ